MFIKKLLIVCVVVFPLGVTANTLLVLGDSLSAAYGMPVSQGWVALMEERFIRQEIDYKVVNASISGETTLGAKSRLDKLISEHQPDVVIVELGGNDGLRGFTLDEIERNLVAIIKKIKQADAKVLLVPMQLPPNYGAVYNQRFRDLYEKLSTQMDITLTGFILEDIATDPALMQPDGIHPVASAQSLMLDNIWPELENLVSQ